MDVMNAITDLYDMTDEEFSRWSSEHGNLVEYRFDAYHDVKVYEDGYVEKFYIGD